MNTKKLFFAILLFSISIRAFCQTDIKTYNNMTQEQVIAAIGEPDEIEEGMDCCNLLRYCEKKLVVVVNTMSHHLEGFTCASPDFCILSDYIPGGIRVGDPASKLENYDFASSRYGRNKKENGLTRLPGDQRSFCYDHNTNYIVYQKEFQTIEFAITDNLVQGFVYYTADDTPYLPYDYSNKLW